MHDSMNWRLHEQAQYDGSDPKAEKSSEERVALDMVDGTVYPSEDCRKITMARYPFLGSKPNTVLWPFVNEQFLLYHSSDYTGGVVYEGRADERGKERIWDYCKYHDLAHDFKEVGIPFWIYTGWRSNAHVKEYAEAFTHPSLEYPKIFPAMGCHDWGLCGNKAVFTEWNLAMPNKLFEYIASGIPVVAMNAKNAGKFVEKEGFGINVSNVQELKDRWDERGPCQKNVLLRRSEFTMEKNIHVVENVLEQLLRHP